MTLARGLVLLGLLEVLLTLVDVLVGPGSRLSPEESWNLRAGLQIACGHGDRLWDLQYRTFCGGCTAEAVLSAPLFSALGESLWTWKIVPAGFHLAVVGLGAALAGRAWGLAGALVFVAWMVAAPPFYRDLALTGFGNHTEGTAFVLGAAVLLIEGLRQPWSRRLPLLLAAGAVAGLGVWFAWSTAYGLVAMVLIGGMAWRRGGLVWLLALPLGLLPWRALTAVDPGAAAHARDWWQAFQLAPPGEWWRWLAGDFATGGLLPQAPPSLSLAWWLALWGLGLWGAICALRDRNAARLWAPVALAALLGAWLLRHDAWQDTHPLDTYSPFLLRYRGPLVPLLGLLAAGAIVQHRSLRRVALVVGLVGLSVRPLGWNGSLETSLSSAYPPVVAPPDPTVPSGRPIQRHAEGRTRPQDIQAALDFLADHEDPLNACRLDHVNELGLRLRGLAAEQPDPVLDAQVDRALQDPGQRLQLQGVLRAHDSDPEGP